jgi:hypothetical protein
MFTVYTIGNLITFTPVVESSNFTIILLTFTYNFGDVEVELASIKSSDNRASDFSFE